jgi:hypothetical protein
MRIHACTFYYMRFAIAVRAAAKMGTIPREAIVAGRHEVHYMEKPLPPITAVQRFSRCIMFRVCLPAAYA